jgi:hypothetical protein
MVMPSLSSSIWIRHLRVLFTKYASTASRVPVAYTVVDCSLAPRCVGSSKACAGPLVATAVTAHTSLPLVQADHRLVAARRAPDFHAEAGCSCIEFALLVSRRGFLARERTGDSDSDSESLLESLLLLLSLRTAGRRTVTGAAATTGAATGAAALAAAAGAASDMTLVID